MAPLSENEHFRLISAVISQCDTSKIDWASVAATMDIKVDACRKRWQRAKARMDEAAKGESAATEGGEAASITPTKTPPKKRKAAGEPKEPKAKKPAAKKAKKEPAKKGVKEEVKAEVKEEASDEAEEGGDEADENEA